MIATCNSLRKEKNSLFSFIIDEKKLFVAEKNFRKSFFMISTLKENQGKCFDKNVEQKR